MDAALLTRSDANGLTVLHVADTVGLCIFQCDEGDDEVATCLGGEVLVHCGDVLEEGGVVKANLVAALLKGDAEDLLALDGLGTVGRVYLDDIVRAFAFLLQDGQRLGGEVRGDDTIADLTLDEQRGGLVAGVTQGNEVTIGTHAIGTASTGIGCGNGREFEGNVVNPVDLAQRVAHGQSHGSTGRRDMLEAGGSRQARGLLQLAHKLPGVEGIEEVDVAGTATEHLDGKFTAVGHEDPRGLLVRVAPVL